MIKTVLPLQAAWVQSLVGKLRSCMPYSAAKIRKIKINWLTFVYVLEYVSLGVTQCALRRMCIVLLLVECSINISYFADNVYRSY